MIQLDPAPGSRAATKPPAQKPKPPAKATRAQAPRKEAKAAEQPAKPEPADTKPAQKQDTSVHSSGAQKADDPDALRSPWDRKQ
jgi:hypothetical protein